MRLAVIADIHGLLPALEAAVDEISKEHVTSILVAGDMVAGPNPTEVVNRLRDLECWMVRGNNENYLRRFYNNEAPAWWYNSRQWAFMRWNYQHTSKEVLDFINSLPEQRVVEFPDTSAIRIVHGSPRDPSELIYPDKDISLLDLALAQTLEPVLVLGHTHVPWQMQRNGRLAVNPGAVCGSLSRSSSGNYAILTWAEDHWQAEIHSFKQDIKRIRADFETSGLLEAGGAFSKGYLNDIEKGKNLLPAFVAYAYDTSSKAGYGHLEYVPDELWEQAASTFNW